MTKRKTMTFPEWLDRHYRTKNESRTKATFRFAAEHGLSMPSVYYALQGCRLGLRVANRVSEITDGRVPVASLLVGMTRDELKRQRQEAREVRA
jgi:hypothetical protein